MEPNQETNVDKKPFPNTLAVSDGVVLTLENSPALLAFQKETIKAAEARFKQKYHPQLTAEQQKVQDLTTQVQQANATAQQFAAVAQQALTADEQNKAEYERQLAELKKFNEQTSKLDPAAFQQLIGNLFNQQVGNQMPVTGLQDRIAKLENAQITDYKNKRLAELNGQIFPEMVEGNTVEEVEASISRSVELHNKYFPKEQPQQQQPAQQPQQQMPEGFVTGAPTGEETNINNDQNNNAMYPNQQQQFQQYPQQQYPQQPQQGYPQNGYPQQQVQPGNYAAYNHAGYPQPQQPVNGGYPAQQQQYPQQQQYQQQPVQQFPQQPQYPVNGYPQQPQNNTPYGQYYPQGQPNVQRGTVTPQQPVQQPVQQGYPQQQQFNNGYQQYPAQPQGYGQPQQPQFMQPQAPPQLGFVPMQRPQGLPDIKGMTPEQFASSRENLLGTLNNMFQGVAYPVQ